MEIQLPIEIIKEIVSNLSKVQDLRSAALVDREWCRVSIPELWADPFVEDEPPNQIEKLTTVLLSFIQDQLIKELELDTSLFLKQPMTFDYLVFIRDLKFVELHSAVRSWFQTRSHRYYDSTFFEDQAYHALLSVWTRILESSVVPKNIDMCLSSHIVTYFQSKIQEQTIRRIYRQIISFPNVRRFCCTPFPGQSDLLLQLSQNCKSMREITIDATGNDFSPLDYAPAIAALIGLQKFACFSELFTDAKHDFSCFVEALSSHAATLTSLKLSGAYFGKDNIIDTLRFFQNLQDLRLGNIKITERQFSVIKNQQYSMLRVFHFIPYHKFQTGLPQQISEFIGINGKTLRKINVYICGTDHSIIFDSISNNCPNLITLDIGGTFPNKAQSVVRLLSGCQFLEELKILKSSPDPVPWDAILLVCADIWPPSLRVFDLSGSQVEGEILAKFFERCPIQFQFFEIELRTYNKNTHQVLLPAVEKHGRKLSKCFIWSKGTRCNSLITMARFKFHGCNRNDTSDYWG